MAVDEHELSESERSALHQVELGIEWLHRAHGALVEFHHNTGHAMDYFARAEELFREAENEALADALRDEHLPRGVVDGDRWSYDLLEDFDEGFLCEMVDFEESARQSVSDGQRHVAERAQERAWKRRMRSDSTQRQEREDE
jgi:hypothetical protein